MLYLVANIHLFYFFAVLFGLVPRRWRGGGAAVARRWRGGGGHVHCFCFCTLLRALLVHYWCIRGRCWCPGVFFCFPLPSSAFLCLPLPSSAFLCLPLPSSAFLCRICPGRTLRENRLSGLGKAFQGFFASNKGNVVYRNVDFLCFFSDTNSIEKMVGAISGNE